MLKRTSAEQSNFLGRLWNQWFTVVSTDPNDMFRERTVRGMVPILAFVVVAGSLAMIASNQLDILPVLGMMGAVIVATIIAVLYQQLTVASVLVFLFPVVAAVGSLIASGYLSTAGIVMAFFSVLFGAVVLPRRVTPFLPFGMVIGYALIALNVSPFGSVTNQDIVATSPIVQSVEMAILSTLFFGIGYYLLREFERRRSALTVLVDTLEDRVAERTRDLTIASEIAVKISTILDLDKLLPEIVDSVRDTYNLYHVSIFLVDPHTHSIDLATSAGRQGKRLTHMHFDLDAVGLVPKATRERQMQFVRDVHNNPNYYPNPVLPATQVEVAIPMTVGNTVIGIIDLQSDDPNTLSAENEHTIVSLALQIGIAVRNAQLYTEAKMAREAAEKANDVKSQFLANMSHELRTPLNAILNFTAFVADGVMGPVNLEQVEALQQTMNSGKHLLALINDVLDITKIETGMMQMFIQEVDLNEAVGVVIAMSKGLVKDKPLELITDIEANLPTTFGDKRRLRQVLLNVVANAVKFTSRGSITIRAYTRDTHVYLEVQDTGIGIAPENHPLVFESFKQIRQHMAETPGTGLGMPISKFFIEAHGGRIWFESKLGAGTTFFIDLPILTEPEATQLTALSASSQHKHD